MMTGGWMSMWRRGNAADAAGGRVAACRWPAGRMLPALLAMGATLAAACGGDRGGSEAGADRATEVATVTGPRTIEVLANQGWQNTGVTLEAGQPFQLRYQSGQITEQGTVVGDAEGSDEICGDPGCCEPLPDERRNSLLARLAGETFHVGNGGHYTAAAPGSLFLRLNECDDGLSDNRGSLTIEFTYAETRGSP
jgi:hypothetical protein